MGVELFKDTKGHTYTQDDVINALKEVGAHDAEILYIHTDIGFGKPLLKRKMYIEKLYETLTSLGVKTLIFPTYTFSFCNNEDYDISNSKSKMGMLNEFARKQEKTFRTNDPLLSVCVVGEVPEEFHNLSKYSCGKGSSFEIMSKSDNYKFLFFGAKPTHCFTFMHYVEAIYNVPYRYDKEFTGNVTINGETKEETFLLCTLFDTVIPSVDLDFQDNLETKGILKRTNIGEKEIMTIKGKSSFYEIQNCFDQNINVLLARPYDTFELGKNYTYGNVESVK